MKKLLVIALLCIASPATAAVLCCSLTSADSDCWFAANTSNPYTACPQPTTSNPWMLSVAIQNSQLGTGARVNQIEYPGVLDGICLNADDGYPGSYIVPTVCVRLKPQPGVPLAIPAPYGGTYSPFWGLPFLTRMHPSIVIVNPQGYWLFQSCYKGMYGSRVDYDTITYDVLNEGTSTCGPRRAFTFDAANGNYQAAFGHLPGLSYAPYL